jgi:acyl-CoA reductase-like NAD-dependent aldehyde dehydrogenase
MELGNNSGTIIEPDANLDEAVPRCVMSAFANSGLVCISLQRLYVHNAVVAEFTKRFLDATAKLKVGNPLDKDCDVGPMIDEKEAKWAEMKVLCIEAFAPLVSIYEYESFEDAIRMVEDSPYGLQAGIYTR